MVSRLEPRITKKDADGNPIYRPMVGRINERPNKIKGRNPSWSISTPTEADEEILDQYLDLLNSITAEVKEMREGAPDGDEANAFDCSKGMVSLAHLGL